MDAKKSIISILDQQIQHNEIHWRRKTRQSLSGNVLIAAPSFASPKKQLARVQDWDSNAAIDCLTGRNVKANARTSSKNARDRKTDNTAVDRILVLFSFIFKLLLNKNNC